jgi:transposase-like protein
MLTTSNEVNIKEVCEMSDKEIMQSGFSLLHIKCPRCESPMALMTAITPKGDIIYILLCQGCGYPIIERGER